jgi:hypothetical protein
VLGTSFASGIGPDVFLEAAVEIKFQSSTVTTIRQSATFSARFKVCRQKAPSYSESQFSPAMKSRKLSRCAWQRVT